MKKGFQCYRGAHGKCTREAWCECGCHQYARSAKHAAVIKAAATTEKTPALDAWRPSDSYVDTSAMPTFNLPFIEQWHMKLLLQNAKKRSQQN